MPQMLLTNDGGFQVNKDSTRDVFAGSGLAEERVKRVVAAADGLVARHLTVGLDAVLQTVQLPAGVAHLHSGLADMDADALTLQTSFSHMQISKASRNPVCSLNQRIIVIMFHYCFFSGQCHEGKIQLDVNSLASTNCKQHLQVICFKV